MMENITPTRSAGRPAIEGKKRQYVVSDDAHAWIKAHGGGAYITNVMRAIKATSEQSRK